MNKRILSKLAKAGYFKSANGALYAAVKRALRKPPSPNDVRAIDEPDQESLTEFGVPHKLVDMSQKPPHPMQKRVSEKNSR